jgi:hypothetical protein
MIKINTDKKEIIYGWKKKRKIEKKRIKIRIL